MYKIKTSERNNEKATEFETKSLLYLMTGSPNSDNVDLFIIDCFNDVTGASENCVESWDIQSKGVSSLTPRKIGAALYTLFSNYVSDIDFSHYILFLPPVKHSYIINSSLDLFDIGNFHEKRIAEIHEGLKKEIAERNDADVLIHNSTESIEEFLSIVNFVVDNYGQADYIRRIIKFRSVENLSDEFLTKIFDEIRIKQASKKITNVHGLTLSSIKDALSLQKTIYRKDVELLVVNRVIGNDLFSDRGVPLYFLPAVKDMDAEDIIDLLLDCQGKISSTLFNKNNKKNFWLLLEQIMQLIIKHPRENIKSIYSQITPTIKNKIFTLDETSTLYLISIVKEGLQHENT